MLARLLSEHDGGFDAKRLLFAEHHFSHAASAFYPSPFEEALVLTLDGVGEWATGTVAIGRGRNLEIVKEMRFPHSLGLLYSAFTYYVGFKVNSGEYKLMGLAPYGVPRFKDLILERLLDLKKDGSFRLDMSYFNYLTGLEMTGRKFEQLFGMPARKPESELLTDFHMDVAASIQAVTEEIMLRMARSLAAEHRDAEPVPRRGCCAQLRGERQAAARRRLRRHLDPASLRRRRRFGRRGTRGMARPSRARALGQSARCHEGRLPGT